MFLLLPPVGKVPLSTGFVQAVSGYLSFVHCLSENSRVFLHD